MSYTPQIDSIPYKVITYFKRFPDEELSSRDIGLKYSCDVKNVLNILKAATDTGFLKRDGSVYSAGPNIGDLTINLKPSQPGQAQQTAAASKQPNDPISVSPWGASASQSSARKSYVNINFDALQVENDIPVSLVSGKSARNKWQPLFDKLTAAGQSVALPIEVRGAVNSEISKRNKAGPNKYVKAMISPTQFRIWRTL